MSDVQEAVESVDSTESVGAVESSVGTTGNTWSFDWEDDTGKRTFTKPGELADFIRHGGMRKHEYDTAVEKMNARGKLLDQKMREYEQQQARLNELPLAQWDKRLREDPRLLATIKKAMAEPAQESNLDELLKKRLEPYEQKFKELERSEQERAAAKRREEAFNALKTEYPGAEMSVIDNMLAELNEVPDQDRERVLMKLLLDAHQGRQTPAEIERRAAQKPNRPPSVTSTPGKTPSGKDPAKMTRAELKEAAMRELEKVTG